MVLFFTRKSNKKGKENIKLLSLILYFIILKYNNTFDL